MRVTTGQHYMYLQSEAVVRTTESKQAQRKKLGRAIERGQKRIWGEIRRKAALKVCLSDLPLPAEKACEGSLSAR